MKVLITGASGFIGQHLLQEADLLKHDLYLLSRRSDQANSDSIHWIQSDLSDPVILDKLPADIDVLIHMAGSRKDIDAHAVNVKGSEILIEWVNASTVKRVIYLSSVGVTGMQYSSSPIIVNENTACHPQNVYERSKWQAEQMWSEFGKHHSVLVLRPTNVYGEFHPFHASLNLITAFRKMKKIPCTPESAVNYVYVKDVVKAIVHGLHHPEWKGVFQIGHSMLMTEWIKLVSNILEEPLIPSTGRGKVLRAGTKMVPGNWGGRKAQAKVMSNAVQYSDEALRKHFHYSYGYEEGFKRTIANFKELNLLK